MMHGYLASFSTSIQSAKSFRFDFVIFQPRVILAYLASFIPRLPSLPFFKFLRLYLPFKTPRTIPEQIFADSNDNELSSRLNDLISVDGAGEWPPKTTYGEAWHPVLKPFHDILTELLPSIAVAEVSTEDAVNEDRVKSFRSRFRTEIDKRINVSELRALLEGGEYIMPRDHCNGFFTCIAMSRHGYRWSTIPAVKVAQDEKFIDFPEQLDIAWKFIKNDFGVTSMGGCFTALNLCNFNKQGDMVYRVNGLMTEQHQETEYWFGKMLIGMEDYGLPIYRLITRTAYHLDRHEDALALEYLQSILALLKKALKFFYDNLTDKKVSRQLWMGYVQSFHAFGVGEIIDGEYVQYDGLSGNQAPIILSLDALLCMEPYLTPEALTRYIPRRQRDWVDSLRNYNIRERVKTSPFKVEFEEEFEKMLHQMRLFRHVHLARVRPYLGIPAPERKVMTAGRSVIESEKIPDNNAAMHFLEGLLVKRLRLTK